jgi:myosin heavy subunit
VALFQCSKKGQGVIVKSVLGRKGSLLDTAPSFLLRRKPNNAIRFVIPESNPDDMSNEEMEKSAPAVRVTPLRAVSASAQQSGAHAVRAAQLADVEWLIQEGALATFRSFSSFAYGASLLFHASELTYYVVLHHESAVWRVLKADDIDSAEPAFRHFIEQATRLAEAEMRRAHLEAQNEQLARLNAESEKQVERTRIDIQRGASMDQQVAMRQQQLRKELAHLEAQRVASHVQLNRLQRQMHQLNASGSDGLPHLPAAK